MILPTLTRFISNSYLAGLAACLFLTPWAFFRLKGEIKCGLAPALVMADFKPGEPLEVSLEVSNGSSSPISMHGNVMDYWYDNENKKVFAPPGTMPHSAAAWIEFVPRTFIVPPKGSSKVKMMITPPKNAEGSFYAVAFVESKPELTEPAQDSRQAIFTNIRLGALVFLAAENSQKYSIAVSDVKITPPTANGSLELELSLQNDSNTHIFPESDLVVMNAQHRVVAKAQGEIKRFLPGQKDHLSISWSGNLPAGSYSALLSLLYGKTQTYTKELQFKVENPFGTTLAENSKSDAKPVGLPLGTPK